MKRTPSSLVVADQAGRIAEQISGIVDQFNRRVQVAGEYRGVVAGSGANSLRGEVNPFKEINDTVYGLSGYISGDQDRAIELARRLRTGQVHINGAGPDFTAPFGGYKQSGNGREWGPLGIEEYLETKAILGATTSDH